MEKRLKKRGGIAIPKSYLEDAFLKSDKSIIGLAILFKKDILYDARRIVNLDSLEFFKINEQLEKIPIPNKGFRVLDLGNHGRSPKKNIKWEFHKNLKRTKFDFAFFDKAMLLHALRNSKMSPEMLLSGTKVDYGSFKSGRVYSTGTKCFSFEISRIQVEPIDKGELTPPASIIGAPCPPLWEPRIDDKGNDTDFHNRIYNC